MYLRTTIKISIKFYKLNNEYRRQQKSLYFKVKKYKTSRDFAFFYAVLPPSSQIRIHINTVRFIKPCRNQVYTCTGLR